MILLSLVAFGFALISWKYIETPFRTKTVFSRRFIFISSLVIGLSFIAIGRIIIINKGFPERWSNEIGAVTELAAKPALLESKCFGGMQEFMHPDESCVLNAPLEAHFAIWGDSHSIVLAQEFANQLKDNAEALRIFSFSGCPPVNDIHFSEPTRQLCPSYNHLVLDYIKSHSEITTIILFARWSMYLDGEAYDNGEGGTTGSHQLFALPVGKDAHFLDHPDRIKAVGALFRAQIETLISLGKKVVLVYPVPEIGWSVPERMAKSIFQHPGSERQPVSINYNRYKQRSADFNAQMTILPDNANVLRIHPDEVFCDSGKYGRCRAELEGKPLYFDDNHLGALGAALLSKQIKDAMKLKGWL